MKKVLFDPNMLNFERSMWCGELALAQGVGYSYDKITVYSDSKSGVTDFINNLGYTSEFLRDYGLSFTVSEVGNDSSYLSNLFDLKSGVELVAVDGTRLITVPELSNEYGNVGIIEIESGGGEYYACIYRDDNDSETDAEGRYYIGEFAFGDDEFLLEIRNSIDCWEFVGFFPSGLVFADDEYNDYEHHYLGAGGGGRIVRVQIDDINHAIDMSRWSDGED